MLVAVAAHRHLHLVVLVAAARAARDAGLAARRQPAADVFVRAAEEGGAAAARADRRHEREDDHRLLGVEAVCVAVDVPDALRQRERR